MSSYEYGSEFYDYLQVSSLMSARRIVPLAVAHLHVSSVLDVGCGAGAWMRAYLEAGVADVQGLDGAYVRNEQLLVEAARFHPADLRQPFRLPRRFDLVQCLEVAEHLPPAASETLVDSIVAHGGSVLFSAAPPGQGGEHHVNEQPYEYWRQLFAARGYELFDFVRPRILERVGVEPWYRYNIFLFVHRDQVARLSPEVLASHVPRGRRVPDVSPWTFRVRKALLARVPAALVTRLATMKHRLVIAGARRGAIQ
jgi:SAM-dependent methyltransferase